MTTATQPSDLRKAEPVSDALLLGAIDRAQRHRRDGHKHGVGLSRIAEHLGFVYNSATTRKLRPQFDAFKTASLIEDSKRGGYLRLRLTSAGRRRLANARRAGKALDLPEAPQHRQWRHARAKAAERIDGLQEQARDALDDARTLFDGEPDSDTLYDLADRLQDQLWRLAAARYCLREWAEPEDAHADLDDDFSISDPRKARRTVPKSA